MTATTIRVQMAQRKDTAANWTAANPILLSGEIGYETDTKKLKIGDGTTNWNGLAYLPIPDGSGNLTITGNLEIGSTGSLTFEGSTADGFETTLAVTDPTADRTITFPDVSGTVVTTGDTGSVTSTMIADGTIVNADVSATAEIAVSKLANGTANQVLVTDGTDVSWSDDLTLAGNLTVNGTTTTVNTETLVVEDKNIELGVVATPTDLTADGGGITLKGTTDKTFNWVDATDSWTSSEHVDLASGKSYRINGTEVLSATALGSAVQISSANIPNGTIVDSDINASAEIAVSKLADGAARQLLQTDAAGTGVEWTDNVDIPGTLDVTGAATFDSSVAVIGALTKSGNDVVTVGDIGTVTSTMIADDTIVDSDINASAAIADTKLGTIATAGKVSNSATTATDANTASAIVARDASGNFSAGAITASLTGNASSATALATARTIGGVSFDGTANIDLPGVNTAGNQDTSGNAATATKLSTARTFEITGDITGTVSSDLTSGASIAAAIASGVIVDADINATAAIADTKLATISTAGKVSNSATTATDANTASAIVARDASGNFAAGTITADLAGNAATVTTNANLTGDITSIGNATSIAAGVIVDADVNASAAIAGTKISPDFGAQNVTTTGTSTAASFIPTSSTVPTNGVYLPAADSVALSTNGTGRLFVDANGGVKVENAASNGSFAVVSSDTGTSTIGLGDLTNNLAGSISYNNSTNAFTFTRAGSTAYTSQNDHVYYTSGTEKLRITSAGLVGIGTSSPDTELEVVATAPEIKARATGNNTGKLSTDNNRAASVIGGQILSRWNGNTVAQIDFINGADGTNKDDGEIAFSTANNASNPLERMRITQAGNVGIGTTSPGAPLDVIASRGNLVRFQESGSPFNGLVFSTDSTGATIKSNSGTGYLAFNTGNSESARIDSSGRLLVGTSSSRSDLVGLSPQIQVEGGSQNASTISATRNSNDIAGSAILLAKSRGTTAGAVTVVQNNDLLGGIYFMGADGTNVDIGAQITGEVDGAPGNNDLPSRLVFSTAPSGSATPVERMRITSAGDILLNTGTSSTALGGADTNNFRWNATSGSTRYAGYVESNTSSSVLFVNQTFNDTATRGAIRFYRTGTEVGSITVSTTATAYNTSSDYRLKENVAPVTDGITRLQQLKPSRFNFIADPTKTVDGFLAHEVQAIVPEAITGEKDAVDEDGNPQYQGIDQSKLVPLLTAALQEAVAKIKNLEARLTAAGL